MFSARQKLSQLDFKCEIVFQTRGCAGATYSVSQDGKVRHTVRKESRFVVASLEGLVAAC